MIKKKKKLVVNNFTINNIQMITYKLNIYLYIFFTKYNKTTIY